MAHQDLPVSPGPDDPRPVDRTVDGVPYFANQDQFLYVIRGWDEATPVIDLHEWLGHVDRDPELRRDEVFDQLNIHTDRIELWCEPGRSHWSRLPADEWIHFAPSRVLYLFSRTFHGGPVRDRWARIVDKLGLSPSLSAWQAYVAEDRYLEMPDLRAVDPWPAHVCGLWCGKRGQMKHVFRWFPPCVWLYRQGGVAGADGYRDVHRIQTGSNLEPSKPERMGPPMWKVDGCPTNGGEVT